MKTKYPKASATKKAAVCTAILMCIMATSVSVFGFALALGKIRRGKCAGRRALRREKGVGFFCALGKDKRNYISMGCRDSCVLQSIHTCQSVQSHCMG